MGCVQLQCARLEFPNVHVKPFRARNRAASIRVVKTA
jgi:hypothetical protein